MLKIWVLMGCILLTGCSLREVPEESVPEIAITEEGATPGERVEPTQEEPPPEPEKIYRNHQEEGGEFELPLSGACGFIGVASPLKDGVGGSSIATLPPGTGFYILEEEGDWWKISVENQVGWVDNRNCLVNLPDLIPSIVYENPYANICYSCSLGKDIPHVTGVRLYEALFFNQRLGEDIYLTPVLYGTAKKLNIAQQSALAEGNSLLIYECYRPYAVQKQLVDGLAELMYTDPEVHQALTSAPWSKAWFVSTGISSHQKGRSVDMTLVRMEEITEKTTGDYRYSTITAYTPLEMPTQFDELSPLAATFSAPVSTTGDAWKNASYSSTMTESAILLQQYATEAGLTPLASEWWHFNDNTSGSGTIVGDFMLDKCYSVPPGNPSSEGTASILS